MCKLRRDARAVDDVLKMNAGDMSKVEVRSKFLSLVILWRHQTLQRACLELSRYTFNVKDIKIYVVPLAPDD